MKIEKMTLRFTSAALALAALSACGPVNRSFDTVKMPIVASNQLSHDVAANVSGIDPAGARALDDWFASINLGYGDRVTVDDPVSYGAAERRAAVAQAVGRYGLLLDGTAPVTRGSVPAGMVRVVVTRSTARVDNCPDWSAPSHPNVQASTTSNFGCASQSNLAAMIADPNDLLAGKPYAGGDPNTAVKSVDAWNKAEPTSKVWETTSKVEMKGN